MTDEEIENEFNVAPIWLDYALTQVALNIKFKCNMKYYSLTEFCTTTISCSSGWLLKCDDWKLVMNRFNENSTRKRTIRTNRE